MVKGKTLIYLFILLLLMGVIAIALSHQAELYITPSTLSFNIKEKINDTPEFIINYTISFSKNDFSFNKLKGFDTIQLDDGIYTRWIGKPMIPIKTIRVALPVDMNVSTVKILSLVEQPIHGTYLLIPAQLPQHRNITLMTNLNQQLNHTLYNSNTPYPNEHIRFIRQMDLAGQNMAELAIYPIHYLGAQKRLTIVTSLTFSLEGTKGYQCGDYLSKKASNANRETYEQMVKEMVINPNEVQLQVSPRPQPLGVQPGNFEYVIITPQDWVSTFQPLTDWKTRKGIPATIVTTSWIYTQGGYSGTQAQKIRAFIIDAYTHWGTTYFLLGADTNNIPTYTKSFTLSGTNYDVPSDTYYADYDDDWVCEVHVGRASVRNITHVTTFVNKVLTYEKTPPLTNYTTTAFFCGFDLNESGSGEGQGCKEYIKNTWIPSGWTYRWEYDNETTNHKTETINNLNLGNNLVNHIDHSNTDLLGTGTINHNQGITTTDALNQTNGNKQSIIYSIGCWACDFIDEECVAEGFLHNTDGGAVAFIGNTRYGWHLPYYTDYYSLRFDRYFFRSLFTQEHYTLGVTFSDHKNDAYSDAGNGTLTDYNQYIFYELTLLGDPELPVWTENPMSLNVTHPNQLHRNSEPFMIMVTSDAGIPINHASVCLWKDTEIYLTGYTNTTGAVTFYPSPVTVGWMNVTVTKHNYLPYEGSAAVVNQPPVSNFIYSPLYPTTSDTIQFTDTSADSDGTIISWSWSFGDGTTSTIRNPSHQYADDGIYLVSLTVTDNDGAENTTTQSITVSNIPPLANFIYSPVHPTTSDPLQFNDTSIDIDGMITLWSWSFGDGTTSPLQNASHQYTKQGTYNITLNVTDDDGAHATKSTSIFVTNTPPIANFMYTPLNPTTSDIIQFTDTSTDPDGTIISWSWTFGDGNTSIQRHPTHTYQKKGIYIITLEIRDDNEATNTVSKSIAVANTPPKVYFTYSPSNPKTIDTIQFNDTSIDSDGLIISWIWTFGDGGTSTERNPSHTYESAGFYTVTLTVTDNDGGENITNTLLQIANTPPTSNFSYTPTYPTIYDLVYFSDTSIDPDGTLQSWYWDFGDGIHSNTRNPTHQFTQNRTFTVTLEVTDNNGSTDSFTKEIITRKIYKKTTYAGNETTLDFLNETQTILSITTTTPTNVTMSKYSQNPTGKNIYNNISNLENYIDITVEKESVIQWPVFIKMYYTQENLANSHVTKNQLIGIYFWDNSTMEWNSYDNTGVNTSDNQNGYEGYCWAQVWHLTTLVQAGDTEPPMKVEGLTVSNAHNGRLNLIWGTGTDNVQIHHYKIYSNSIFLINRTSTSYQDIGLVNGQSYTYRVSAVDTSGNEGEPSNPKSNTPTESSSGGGGSSGGAGGTPPPGPQNKNPIANASAGAPYQGFINSAILFNGSSSYDPDGNITKWLWVFGDNSNGTGKTVQHSYLKTGTFNVTLTVFDDEGATNTATITCEITQPNRPPSKPLITGPINGKKNTMYNYTALSSDADNDTLQYTFDWGDSLSQTSTFLPNGSGFIANHSWMYAGRYDVTVTVTDNQTASSSKVSIYIDATQIGEIGYLIDYNGDGIYDAFYSDKLTQTVTIEEKNGNYNIDTDGDGDWDYTYDTTGKLSAYQQPQTPGFELIFVLCACVLTVLLWRKKQIV